MVRRHRGVLLGLQQHLGYRGPPRDLAQPNGKPANAVFHPSDRDRTWIRLFTQHKGKIGEGFGRGVHDTSARGVSTLRRQVHTSAMARSSRPGRFSVPRLAIPGNLRTRTARLPNVQAVVSNDWTILTPTHRRRPIA